MRNTSSLFFNFCKYLIVSSRFFSLFDPIERTFNSLRLSNPLSEVIWFENSDKSVSYVHASKPSIFSIRLNDRSNHFRCFKVLRPLIFVMMLLSSYNFVSLSIPPRLSISTMSKEVSYVRKRFNYFCKRD